jgi:hypothetical protein
MVATVVQPDSTDTVASSEATQRTERADSFRTEFMSGIVAAAIEPAPWAGAQTR